MTEEAIIVILLIVFVATIFILPIVLEHKENMARIKNKEEKE